MTFGSTARPHRMAGTGGVSGATLRSSGLSGAGRSPPCAARSSPCHAEELARFLPGWQGLGHSATRGVDGLLRTVEQLAGVPLPVSALETLVLPSRVADYAPGWLDELTLAGEIVWAGAGSLPNHDGWIVLAPTDTADLLLPLPESDSLEPLHRALLDALDGDQALFYRALADRASAAGIAGVDDGAIAAAIWDLVWAGWLTNDTLGPVRSLLGASRSTTQPRRRRTPRGRYARYARLAAGAGSGAGPSGGRTYGASSHGRTVVAPPAAGGGSDPACCGTGGCAARPIWRGDARCGGRGKRDRWVLRGISRPESGRRIWSGPPRVLRRGPRSLAVRRAGRDRSVTHAVPRPGGGHRVCARGSRHRSGESIRRGTAVAGSARVNSR